MAVALYTNADVVLVADIDRGGAFASLLGTWEWLESGERALVRGFVLNKFRGDPALLSPAPSLLEERTGVPVLGVVPYIEDIALPEEDAASLTTRRTSAECVQIAVVRLPHLANFDEFAALAGEPNVWVRYVSRPEEMRAPDLVVLPGTKATIPDLLWLQERGIGSRIRWLAQHGTPVLGICGGYQMLGTLVSDPLRTESEHAMASGLCLLQVESELTDSKRLVQTCGSVRDGLAGIWSSLGGAPVEGYEIHTGHTRAADLVPLLDLEPGADGAVSDSGGVAGTYMHGLFERREPRHALLRKLAATRGYQWQPKLRSAGDPIDRLADVLQASLQIDGGRFRGLAAIDGSEWQRGSDSTQRQIIRTLCLMREKSRTRLCGEGEHQCEQRPRCRRSWSCRTGLRRKPVAPMSVRQAAVTSAAGFHAARPRGLSQIECRV